MGMDEIDRIEELGRNSKGRNQEMTMPSKEVLAKWMAISRHWQKPQEDSFFDSILLCPGKEQRFFYDLSGKSAIDTSAVVPERLRCGERAIFTEVSVHFSYGIGNEVFKTCQKPLTFQWLINRRIVRMVKTDRSIRIPLYSPVEVDDRSDILGIVDDCQESFFVPIRVFMAYHGLFQEIRGVKNEKD